MSVPAATGGLRDWYQLSAVFSHFGAGQSSLHTAKKCNRSAARLGVWGGGLWGFGFGIWGFRVSGSGLGVWGLGFGFGFAPPRKWASPV